MGVFAPVAPRNLPRQTRAVEEMHGCIMDASLSCSSGLAGAERPLEESCCEAACQLTTTSNKYLHALQRRAAVLTPDLLKYLHGMHRLESWIAELQTTQIKRAPCLEVTEYSNPHNSTAAENIAGHSLIS